MKLNTKYEILTPNGFEHFDGINKIKKTSIQFTFDNDFIIRCSPNHKFFTENTQILAKDIRIGNKIKSKLGLVEITHIKKFYNKTNLYDIVNSGADHTFYSNNIISHNCNFLGSGDNVIPQEYIVHQETTNVKLPIKTSGFDNKIWIWEEPIEGHQYLLGADVSRGDSADFSTMVIFDVDSGHQVMEYQGKVAPDVLGEMINEWGLKYDAMVVVDVTGGMGQATIIKLLDLKYPNIYYSDPKNNKIVKERMYKYRKQGELIPGFIISTNRTLVVEALSLAIRDGAIAIRSTRLISELKTFIYNKGRPDHAPNKHDDIIMACAMALFVLQHSFKDLKRFKAQTVAMLNAWSNSSTPMPDSTQNSKINDVNDFSWLFD